MRLFKNPPMVTVRGKKPRKAVFPNRYAGSFNRIGYLGRELAVAVKNHQNMVNRHKREKNNMNKKIKNIKNEQAKTVRKVIFPKELSHSRKLGRVETEHIKKMMAAGKNAKSLQRIMKNQPLPTNMEMELWKSLKGLHRLR